MLAKSHTNLGFLTALLLKAPLEPGPTAAILTVFNLVPGIFRFVFLAIFLAIGITLPAKAGAFLVPLAVLAGSLFPDLDEPNSAGSLMIAPTQIVLRILLMGIGGVVIWQGWGMKWAMAIGIFLILSGALNLKILPMEKLQRLLLIAAGISLIAWAHNEIITGLGVLYLLMGVLSHRGLTHSPEGILLALAGAWCFTFNIGHPELLKPFIIGYATHYFADALSNHGVYATYLGKVKIGFPLISTSSLVDRIIGFVSLVFVLLLSIGGMGHLRNLLPFICQLIN